MVDILVEQLKHLRFTLKSDAANLERKGTYSQEGEILVIYDWSGRRWELPANGHDITTARSFRSMINGAGIQPAKDMLKNVNGIAHFPPHLLPEHTLTANL